MFFVFRKDKIFAYIISILTVFALFFIAEGTNNNSEVSVEVISNSIENTQNNS